VAGAAQARPAKSEDEARQDQRGGTGADGSNEHGKANAAEDGKDGGDPRQGQRRTPFAGAKTPVTRQRAHKAPTRGN